MHGMDIAVQKLTSNIMDYSIPWVDKPPTINPTMIESILY